MDEVVAAAVPVAVAVPPRDAGRRGSVRQPEEEDPADDSGDSLDAKDTRIYPRARPSEPNNQSDAATLPAARALKESTSLVFPPRNVQSEPRMRSASAAASDARVTTKLLGGARMDVPVSYGTNVTMQRRHSILRMSSSGRGMKKSASVEFILSQEEQVKIVEQSIHLSGTSISSRDKFPRRLTFEEKEELYRQRPDLEIGPAPYYNEKVQEMNTRNQRRIIFAMFGGMLSIVLLLIIYSVLAGAGQLGPM